MTTGRVRGMTVSWGGRAVTQALAESHPRLKSWPCRRRGFKPGLRPRMTGALATRSRIRFVAAPFRLARRSGLALLLAALAAQRPRWLPRTPRPSARWGRAACRCRASPRSPHRRSTSAPAPAPTTRSAGSTTAPGCRCGSSRSSDVWRRIEDPDGETGWAHASLLSVLRTVIVRGPGDPGTAPHGGQPTAAWWPGWSRGSSATLGGCDRRLVPDRGRGRARLAAARGALGRCSAAD